VAAVAGNFPQEKQEPPPPPPLFPAGRIYALLTRIPLVPLPICKAAVLLRLYLVRPWRRFGMAAAAVTQPQQPLTTQALNPGTAAAAAAETQPAQVAHPCSAATAALLVQRVQREPSPAVAAALLRAPLARVALVAQS
jgi:predicted MFS family arabinose efflux permease